MRQAALRSLRWIALVLVATAIAVTTYAILTRSSGTPAVAGLSGPLRVDPSGRFIETPEGKPFFWLADTAWDMVTKASRADVKRYLLDRSAKGFDVVQILVGGDRRDAPYWAKVDNIVDEAASMGIYVAIVPCWACLQSDDPTWADPAEITAYGRFLGARYGSRYVVWLLGGEAGPANKAERDRYTVLADAIASGAGGQDRVLISVQPEGGHSSSDWFEKDPWLDFNTLQSGHVENAENYDLIDRDYARAPAKPTHEGEVFYEDIPSAYWEGCCTQHRATAYDERKGAYWGVFAGGFGHTYGAEGVWNWTLDDEVGNRDCCGIPLQPWYRAMEFPGAVQMHHLRDLIDSRPYLTRIPDQSIIASDAGSGDTRVQATRGSDGSYAFVYISDGHATTVKMDKVSGGSVRAWWYDPRTGTPSSIGAFPDAGMRTFTPPSSGPGNDWVLVLDDASRGFPPPGEATESLP